MFIYYTHAFIPSSSKHLLLPYKVHNMVIGTRYIKNDVIVLFSIEAMPSERDNHINSQNSY